MNKERKLIIAGNWKMNKTVAEALALVNGLLIDIRRAPIELQRLAHEKGLIPFIPAERQE